MAAPPELWARSPYRKGRVAHFYRKRSYGPNGADMYSSICGICAEVHPTLFRLTESDTKRDKCPQCERAVARKNRA